MDNAAEEAEAVERSPGLVQRASTLIYAREFKQIDVARKLAKGKEFSGLFLSASPTTGGRYGGQRRELEHSVTFGDQLAVLDWRTVTDRFVFVLYF